MIRAAALALTLALAGCVPASQGGGVTLSGSAIAGGTIGATERLLARYEAQGGGGQVVIAGDAYSDGAIGILSRRWENLCVMPEVSLHLHAANRGGIYHTGGTQKVHDAILHPGIRAEFNSWLWQRVDRHGQDAVNEWLSYSATELARRSVITLCP